MQYNITHEYHADQEERQHKTNHSRKGRVPHFQQVLAAEFTSPWRSSV
jgi:hypothetical protein